MIIFGFQTFLQKGLLLGENSDQWRIFLRGCLDPSACYDMDGAGDGLGIWMGSVDGVADMDWGGFGGYGWQWVIWHKF